MNLGLLGKTKAARMLGATVTDAAARPAFWPIVDCVQIWAKFRSAHLASVLIATFATSALLVGVIACQGETMVETVVVEREVPATVLVDREVTVVVEKEVEREVATTVLVDREVTVVVEKEVEREVAATVLVDREVTVVVEKEVEREVPATVLVDKEVTVVVEKEVPATVIVEKEVTVVVEPTPTPTPEPTSTPEPTPTPAASAGRVVFASNREGNWDIYSMNADGSNVNRLTDVAASDTEPTWSPDGNRIAFVSDRSGFQNIYIMDADGSNVTQITDARVPQYNPSWSPDGGRIAFASEQRDNWPSIWVVNTDRTGLTRLTDDESSDTRPSWSPDGRRIAFQSVGGRESWGIFVMNADGSNATHLEDAYGGNPSWSPDGRRIAYHDHGGEGITVVDMEDGSLVWLFYSDLASHYDPAWSPDGRCISFSSNRDGDPEIYVATADGWGATRLTDNVSAFDRDPSWTRPVDGAVEIPGCSSDEFGSPPFALEWETSATSVEAGESFILNVRIYKVRDESGRGGVSVSFPSLNAPTGSRIKHFYSSGVADVEVLDYTNGLSNVSLNHPGSSVLDNTNTQISADHLLVESHDSSWERIDDRTLRIRVTPKVAGEFPIRIRGRLCARGSVNCAQHPVTGTEEDQQGWEAESVVLRVEGTSESTPDTAEDPAAGRIVFASDRSGHDAIWVMNADGSGATQLTDDSASRNGPRWSLDGLRISFHQWDGEDREIWVMNADGSDIQRLTHDEFDVYETTWSPDGKRILFTGWHRESDMSVVYVVSTDGSGAIQLNDDGTGDIYDPTWSPDSRRIAYHSSNGGIWVMNADGTRNTLLTRGDIWGNRPTWAPDGQSIVFSDWDEGNLRLWLMNADGSGITPITESGFDARDPIWSPDGTRIAFIHYSGGNPALWVVDADGQKLRQLTDSMDWRFSWSPDGQHITFGSDRYGDNDIWIVNVETLDTTRLSPNVGRDWEPDW